MHKATPESSITPSNTGFINTSTAQPLFPTELPEVTTPSTRSRTSPEVSICSVSSIEANGDDFHTPVGTPPAALLHIHEPIDTASTFPPFITQTTSVEQNKINFQYRNFFGPKTLSVLASIGSITCVVLANVLKLASHTHLGLSIAALVLATLAFSLMINELVAVTSGRHFVKS
jgi:hypothetical protein